MKKINLFLLLFLIVLLLFPAQGQKAKKTPKVKKRFTVQKAAAYQEEMLLISETDINCTYFIRKNLSEDLVISGAEKMDMDKELFSDADRVYINKGSNDGINEQDIFLVIGKGSKISNRLNWKNLGTYYQKKSQAVVSQIYEDKAVVTLKKGCHPVNVGDILIPYQEPKTVFEKKLDYKKSRLPEFGIEGNVVYLNSALGTEREIVGATEYLTVDLGRAMLSKGDWLLFYKKMADDLPPIIVGSGIVLNSQNSNSTVKVIESAFPVEVGFKLVLFRDAGKRAEKDAVKTEEPKVSTPQHPIEMEDIPTIDTGEKVGSPPGEKKGEETLELDVLFDLNKASIKDKYKKELQKIKEFIDAKSEYTIILRGYSCSIGGLEYNLKLSKKRVESIKKYLMETYKIKKEFFETYHYGEKDTPHKNVSEEQRKKNRLVNIEVIGR